MKTASAALNAHRAISIRVLFVWTALLWLSTSAYFWIFAERWLEGLSSPIVFALTLPPALLIAAVVWAVFRLKRNPLRIALAIAMPFFYATIWIATFAVLVSIFIVDRLGQLSLIFLVAYVLLIMFLSIRKRPSA
jgi:hypothetical protein